MPLLPLLTLIWLSPAAPQDPTPPVLPRVDLNTATEAELMALPGVGPKRATAIVERRQRRPFRRVRDLRSVKGIGPKRYRRLKPLVQVRRPEAPARKPKKRPAVRRSRAPRCWPRPLMGKPPRGPAPCDRRAGGQHDPGP